MYGTIGSEYAALGLKVVNACRLNPHAAYSFNFNPKTRSEYEEIILNLHEESIEIKSEEIYEWFYLTYLNLGISWIFSDEQFYSIYREVNNPQNIEIYSYFLEKHHDGYLDNFPGIILDCIIKNDYRLDMSIRRTKGTARKDTHKNLQN